MGTEIKDLHPELLARFSFVARLPMPCQTGHTTGNPYTHSGDTHGKWGVPTGALLKIIRGLPWGENCWNDGGDSLVEFR